MGHRSGVGIDLAARGWRRWLEVFRPVGVEPAEDYGFFGPDSVTWKVWSYPSSLTVGFIRAVTVEELDPALVAAVDKTHDIYRRPSTRYDRTLRYFAMVAFADTRSTARASDVLVKVHSKAIGIEPYSGKRYDANDPQSQLWIHLTAWHSILYAYERFGPGQLSAADEARYWAECATAAELQTCDPADVPTSRDGVRAYFERMRPLLSGSPIARKAMQHLVNGTALVLPLPRQLAWITWMVNRVVRAAVIATMPRWMQAMGGFEQSRWTALVVVPVLRIAFRMIHASSPGVELRLLRLISPSSVDVVAPVLYGVAPRNCVVLTPSQARDRYGYDKPTEAHLPWRDKQRARVFMDQSEPSDDGLIESEPILGPIGCPRPGL